jgi:hypothetical protein
LARFFFAAPSFRQKPTRELSLVAAVSMRAVPVPVWPVAGPIGVQPSVAAPIGARLSAAVPIVVEWRIAAGCIAVAFIVPATASELLRSAQPRPQQPRPTTPGSAGTIPIHPAIELSRYWDLVWHFAFAIQDHRLGKFADVGIIRA